MANTENCYKATITEGRKIWSFTKDAWDHLFITSYKGTDIDIVIPAYIGKDPVTQISCEAFSPLQYQRLNKQREVLYKIRSVVIPPTVETIGYGAFAGCYSLESVTIPNSVDSIGERAFYRCERLNNVSIPDSVKSIGKEAFEQCLELSNVSLPENIKEIGENAFTYCYGLTDEHGFGIIKNMLCHYCGNKEDIVVPNGVTAINNGIFTWIPRHYILSNFKFSQEPYECRVKSITIPDSVNYIDPYAFGKRENITIRATVGSYAEAYAKEHNIPFVAI